MIVSKERHLQIDEILKHDEENKEFGDGKLFEQFIEDQIKKRNLYYIENSRRENGNSKGFI